MEEKTKTILRLVNAIGPSSTLVLPLEVYRKKLFAYLTELYINSNKFIDKPSQEALDSALILSTLVTPEDTTLQNITETIYQRKSFREKTQYYVRVHLNQAMKILGNICELMLIEHCRKDRILNKKCINIAMFKPDIAKDYSDIDYDKYIPISPAKKFMRTNTELIVPNTFRFDGNHPSKDIIWVNKNDTSDVLQVTIPDTGFIQDASLQIKATSKIYRQKNKEQYITSPIIGISIDSGCQFDFLHDKIHDSQIIVDIKQLDVSLSQEAEKYFKLLIAHLANIWDLGIEIDEKEIVDDGVLNYLFSTSLGNLLSEDIISDHSDKIAKFKEFIEENCHPNQILARLSIIH